MGSGASTGGNSNSADMMDWDAAEVTLDDICTWIEAQPPPSAIATEMCARIRGSGERCCRCIHMHVCIFLLHSLGALIYMCGGGRARSRKRNATRKT